MPGMWRPAFLVRRTLLIACCALMAGAWAGEAIPPGASTAPGGLRVGTEAETARFVSERILPVFARYCLECHGATKQRGGLRMDTLEGALKGGSDAGPGIVPWKPERSSIVASMRWDGDDEDQRMPPKQKLADGMVADVTRWVAMGAPWPEAASPRMAAGAAPPRPLAPRPPLLGRLHPALVHMPIAILLLAGLFELLGMMQGDAWRPALRVSLMVVVAAGALSIASGSLAAGGQEQERELLLRHQQAGWLAIILAFAALAADLAPRHQAPARWLSRLLLIAAVVAMVLAGHWGGDMVHGSWW